jgi:lipopolysaccharide heptosyltransferase II
LRLAGSALGPTVWTARRTPRRVLLLRPDHIGDVLLTAPAVALVRANLPHAHLTYLVGPWSAEAARRGPPVDEVRTLPYPGFTRRRNPNVLQPYALLVAEALRLRRERYDVAVVFRPDHWWGALLALAAGIPVRVGGLKPETTPLLTHCYARAEGEHAAVTALATARLALEAVGISPSAAKPVSQFRVSQAARDDLRGRALPDQPIIALHPSAGAPLKSWPIESWARLADALIEQHLGVVLTGGPSDEPLLSEIANRTQHPVDSACGQSLEVSAAIFERCALVVTVDGGAGHLAAAVGTPTVRLYGPAPTAAFGPWPPRSDQRVLVTTALDCVPCGNLDSPPCGARRLPACMLALSVEEVVNAVMAQLHQG